MNQSIKLKCIRNTKSPFTKTFLRIARPYMVEVDPDKADLHEAFLRSMLSRQGELDRWLTLFMWGNECVGFAHFKVDRDEKPGWGYILEYYVVPRRRRQGLGKRYLSLVLNVLRIAGCRNVWLTSHPMAEAFWGACGFTGTGELERGKKIMARSLIVRKEVMCK